MMHKIKFLDWNQSFAKSIQNTCLEYSALQKKIKLILPNIDVLSEISEETKNIEKIEIVTLKQFLSSFSKNKIANSTLRIFTWHKILSDTDTLKLQEIFPGEFKFGNTNLFNLARIINKISETVFTCDLDLFSVARISEQEKIDNPVFWKNLGELSERYLQNLKANGYIDINHELISLKEFKLKNEVVIIAGCQNLSRQQQRIIESIPDLIIAINAPKEHANGYCDNGSLEPEYWENINIDIEDENILFNETTNDEIEMAAELCSKETCLYSLEDNTQKLLLAKLEANNLKFNNHIQQKLSSNGLIKLILKFIDYAVSYSANSVALLIRDPYLRKTIPNCNQLIHDLNQIRSNFFPEKIKLNCNKLQLHAHRESLDKLYQVTENFKLESSIERALTSLIENLGIQIKEEDAKSLAILLEQTAKIDESKLNIDTLTSLKETIETLSFTQTTSSSAIKIQQFNNLSFHQSKQYIILGVSDETLPQRSFELINKPLAKAIRLKDYTLSNASYNLSYLSSGNCNFKLLNSRISSKNEALTPSRFLFKNKVNHNPNKILKFTSKKSKLEKEISTENFQTKLPKIQPYEINKITASSFKDYITCPYLFYLRHVLKLSSSNDRLHEMDSLVFGKIAHLVLENFSKNLRLNDSPISSCFNSAFQQAIDRYFQWPTYPIINLQLEQLRERIETITTFQDNFQKEGWQIEAIEIPLDYKIENEGKAVKITGKIDRIDKKKNNIRIIDFKTADQALYFKDIYKDGNWTDLQLAIYALWARDKYPEYNIEIAFLNFPKQSRGAILDCYQLEAIELEQSFQQVLDLTKKITANHFSPTQLENWPESSRNILLGEK